MTLDKTIKDYKASLKQSDTDLKTLENEASRYVDMRRARENAEMRRATVAASVESLASDKDKLRTELSEAQLLGNDAGDLQDEYKHLLQQEQDLTAELNRLSELVAANTPNDADVARLRTRLQNFNGAGTSDLLDGIARLAQEHEKSLQGRVKDALGSLDPVGPRERHNALMELDEGYRKGIGSTLDEYLRQMDEHGRTEQADEELARKFESMDSREVIRARK